MYKLISEAYQEGNPIINALKLCEENWLEKRLSYRIADLLKQGKCLIQNKSTLEYIDKIEVETQTTGTSKRLPLSGWGRRRFSVDGEMFFEVTDWLS